MSQRYFVRGYHGTTLPRAQQIVTQGHFRISRNDYDWLGRGAYFFQDAPLRAWKWACHWVAPRTNEQAAVVSVDIDLQGCFDLLDIANWRFIQLAHSMLNGTRRQRPPAVRSPTGQRHHIISPGSVKGVTGNNVEDCETIRLALRIYRKSTGKIVRSVRGSFIEGQQLYTNSYFFDHSHVQIAVLHPTAIIRRTYLLEDSQLLSQAYMQSGLTRWPI